MPTLATTRMSSKGQVVIPEAIREELGLEPGAQFVAVNAALFDCPPLPEQACADPDDDKFLACALASSSECVVSGDKLLLKVSGYQKMDVIRPLDFVDRYL